MKLTFLGTGDAKQVPVWGCECSACTRARVMSDAQRSAACILLQIDDCQYLLDAGSQQLVQQFRPTDIDTVLLSQFHVDHLMGLFQMRWGQGDSIPVYCPRDKHGCADLYKNSGLLDFKPFKKLFTPVHINPKQPNVAVTAVPLNHNKEALGYCIEANGKRLAYLCDTKGLPIDTENFLAHWQPDSLILECTFAPSNDLAATSHNSLTDVLAIRSRLQNLGLETDYWLTHLSHDMDVYLMEHRLLLPNDIFIAEDNLSIQIGYTPNLKQSYS